MIISNYHDRKHHGRNKIVVWRKATGFVPSLSSSACCWLVEGPAHHSLVTLSFIADSRNQQIRMWPLYFLCALHRTFDSLYTMRYCYSQHFNWIYYWNTKNSCAIIIIGKLVSDHTTNHFFCEVPLEKVACGVLCVRCGVRPADIHVSHGGVIHTSSVRCLYGFVAGVWWWLLQLRILTACVQCSWHTGQSGLGEATSRFAHSMQKRLWPQGTRAATTSDSKHTTQSPRVAITLPLLSPPGATPAATLEPGPRPADPNESVGETRSPTGP